MAESLTVLCPHCRRRLRLRPGREFRCRWPSCGRNFTLNDVMPAPGQFGLTPELVTQLQRDCPAPSQRGLWVLAALSLFCAIATIAPGGPSAGADFFLLCVAATPVWALALWGYNRIKKRNELRHDLAIRQSPHYGDLLRYQQAATEYNGFYFAVGRAEDERLRANERWWKKLDGRQFERELASLYSKRGYEVRSVGGPGDGGVDLILQRDGRTIIVQCKAHRKYISPGAVRDLYGTLVHYRANEAWLVASRGFHQGAIEFAQWKPIRLLTILDVLNDRDQGRG